MKTKRVIILSLSMVLNAAYMLYAQGGGTHPGADPIGMSVPIDGGILMAILAGGGLIAMLFKKKKKEDN